MKSITLAIAIAWAACLPATLAADNIAPIFPAEAWLDKPPAQLGLDANKLAAARDYAFTGEGSGLIVRGGYAAMRWGDQTQRYDLKSTTKSLGATLLGIALLDGK